MNAQMHTDRQADRRTTRLASAATITKEPTTQKERERTENCDSATLRRRRRRLLPQAKQSERERERARGISSSSRPANEHQQKLQQRL